MKGIKIAITGWGSISPLGVNTENVWKRYLDDEHCFTKMDFQTGQEWAAVLSEDSKTVISTLSTEKSKYKQLDPSTLYAMAASRKAIQQAGWQGNTEFGINIGSSRGATTAFEKFHTQFIESGEQIVEPITSPITTLGNIASWTAADLGATGPVISHSITCSTALHAVVNAVAWLKAGFCTRFLVGGSEAPLTSFTLAQMKALKIYSSIDDQYPCRAMDIGKKQNTMILGEGAASFCLESTSNKALAYISGIGYGTEPISHGASLSADALCLQRSIRMALDGHDPKSVDAIILHAPGTIQGDKAEIKSIESVFGKHKPLLTSNKWKLGHSFGASGALSMEMAMLMLKHNQFIQPPYLTPQHQDKPLKKILVNAIGFGGNAVSVLIEN